MADSTQTPQRVWFITGASTGFGRLLAEETLRAGHKVIATARKPEQIANLGYHYADRCLVLPLDVTIQAQVDSAAAQAIAKFGRIDVLVNNAGYGVAGAIEEVSEADFMPMYETNVFGLLRVTRAAVARSKRAAEASRQTRKLAERDYRVGAGNSRRRFSGGQVTSSK